jgi:hypothetical protein
MNSKIEKIKKRGVKKKFLRLEFSKKTQKSACDHNALISIFRKNICYHNFFNVFEKMI